MDYIKQMRGFRERRKNYPISAGAIALYLVLFEYANDFRFPESFSVSALYLRASAELGEGTFKRAREELINGGYIHYRPGQGRQHGQYHLVDFSGTSVSDITEESPEPVSEESFVGQIAGQNDPENGPQSGPQMESNVLTPQFGPQTGPKNGPQTTLQSTLRAKMGVNLARYNNYKYKLEDDSSSSLGEPEFKGQVFDGNPPAEGKALEEISACWRKHIGEPTPALYHIARSWMQSGMEAALICRGIEQSVPAKDAARYLHKVLSNWKKEGILTLAACEAAHPDSLPKFSGQAYGRAPSRGNDGLCQPSYDLDEVNRLLNQEILQKARGQGIVV